jgi:DNA-binding transcriptional LysR family regulator
LKYAVEVERAGSITQAADNLFMAQPNLSKAIRELEEGLGITIFERTPRGVVPTQRGVEFLRRAKEILGVVKEMESLRDVADAGRQVFSLTMPRGSYIAGGFVRFVSELSTEKDIDVRLKETNSVQAILGVAGGDFQLGIIRYQTVNENYFLDFLTEKGLRYEPIWEFENLVLTSAKNPLASAEVVRPEDLADMIEIIHNDAVVPYLQTVESRPRPLGKVDKRVYVYDRSTQFDLLSEIPQTFLWVSPIPEETLRRYRLKQRRCVPGPPRYKDVLIYSKQYRLSELDAHFIDKLYEAKNKVAFKDYH